MEIRYFNIYIKVLYLFLNFIFYFISMLFLFINEITNKIQWNCGCSMKFITIYQKKIDVIMF